MLFYLEKYKAVLINQRKNQKERMELLRQLAVQQIQMLETVRLNNLPKLGVNSQKNGNVGGELGCRFSLSEMI